MRNMFTNSLFDCPIDSFDVSKVKDLRFMFTNGNYNHPLSSWQTGNVGRFTKMFAYSAFNQPIQNWNMSSTIELTSMFEGNSAWNHDLCSWGSTVPSTANVNKMFWQAIQCPEASVDPVLASSPPGPFCYSCASTSTSTPVAPTTI